MKDVLDIVKILREEEKNGVLKSNIKKNNIKIIENDEILDNLWFNQWRFL
jgi:hypothetical protein